MPLQVLERKGLVERVGKGRRGRGGYVCWRRVNIEPLRDFESEHKEHLLAHKVQEVRILQLEKRVAALEDLLVEVGSRLEDQSGLKDSP